MPGIKDRIAVAGVGATRFTEHWEKDQEDLLVEAVDEACRDAGIERSDIQAISAGIYYVVLACGVEKITDSGARGLPNVREGLHPFLPAPSAPAMFAMAATRAFEVHGWNKEALARVAVKNHANGEKHPKAHFRRAITMEDALNAPMIAHPLG